MGNVIPTDTRTPTSPAWPPSTPAAPSRHRLQRQPPVRLGPAAIISAAQAIGYGDCDVAVGGGSHEPYPTSTPPRYGARMGARASTTCSASCTTPGKTHMGITAENVAERSNFAPCRTTGAGKPARAAAAIAGYFRNRSSRRNRHAQRHRVVPHDENVRAATTLDVLAGMGPHSRKTAAP